MKVDIKEYKNITEWLKDYEHKVFRMWKYKKMFTPYEMEQKFVDESVYESDACEYIIITKIIPISNDDYLLVRALSGETIEPLILLVIFVILEVITFINLFDIMHIKEKYKNKIIKKIKMII